MSKYAIGVDYGTLSVRALMVDIQSKNLNLTVAYLYLNIIQESEQLCISMKHYARASRKMA